MVQLKKHQMPIWCQPLFWQRFDPGPRSGLNDAWRQIPKKIHAPKERLSQSETWGSWILVVCKLQVEVPLVDFFTSNGRVVKRKSHYQIDFQVNLEPSRVYDLTLNAWGSAWIWEESQDEFVNPKFLWNRKGWKFGKPKQVYTQKSWQNPRTQKR